MSTLTEQISRHVAGLSEGKPVYAKELLHLGSRAALDQTLSRLTRRGELMRIGRGIYVSPIKTRFGNRAPSAQKVVEGIAQARGESVEPNGAAAANTLGLTTQVPMREQYLTSGRSRRLKLGAQIVELKHAPHWMIARTGRAGAALRALTWLGPREARSALATLKGYLSEQELNEIVAARPVLPGWLAATVSATLAPHV